MRIHAAWVVLLCAGAAGAAEPLPPGAVLRLGDTRYRAPGEVRHIRFSADAAAILAWVRGVDDQLHPYAWDAATGVAVPYEGPSSPPELPVRATPAARLKGDLVVTAGPGCAGRIWDANAGRQLALLLGHCAPVTAVAVSSDARRIVTGSADGLIKLWDAENYHPLNSLSGHTSAIRSVRTAAAGSRAITAGDDGSARVWDLRTGRELRGYQATGPVDLTPDGNYVVFPVPGGSRLRDLVTGLEVIPDRPIAAPQFTIEEYLGFVGLAVAYSPDGRTLAVAHGDGTIGLYETATGHERRVLVGHGATCRGLTFTPDGSRLLTAGADQTVLVWPVRVQDLPLTESIRYERRAVRLWSALCSGRGEEAYLAMARFAAEPDAAVKMARLRLQPADSSDADAATDVADSRVVELLESLKTPAAREFLEELAAGDALAHRTREARRALARLRK